MPPEIQGFLNFISANFHIIGWLTLIGITWKASTHLKQLIDKLIIATDNAQEAKDTIHLVSTNHLPHLQVELEKLNTELANMKSELINEFRVIRQDLVSEFKGVRQDLVNFLLASRNPR